MRSQQNFNFQKQLRHLLPLIKIENQQYEMDNANQVSTIKSIDQQLVKLNKEEEHIFKQQSTCMAQTETSDCLIYALCFSLPVNSQLTLMMVKKSNGKSSKIHMKSIKVIVNIVRFASSSKRQIHLLAGTSCGRLFTYAGFELKHVIVSALKISSADIVDLLVPSFPDCAFALSANSNIYWVNFSEGCVLCQFQCNIPLIQDINSKLIIDNSQLYLGHVFSYGRIILWQINQNLKQKYSINIDDSDSTIRSHEQRQGQNPKNYQQIKGKLIQTNNAKQIILKPKMSLMGMLIDGIFWVDFLGQFLLIITQLGLLQVVAINVNQFNENQEFYTIISQFSLHRQTLNGKKIQSENIVHIQNLPQNRGLLVGKKIMMEQSRKKALCSNILIEKYLFDQEFRLSKLLTIMPAQTNLMREFHLSNCGRFLVVASDRQFTILMSSHLFS